MKNIFSFDSKLMSILESISNTIFLNLLFLLCCIPVFTIGAAFSALYSGCRSMIKHDTCFRAFFHEFRTGFKRSSLTWLILLPLCIFFSFNTTTILYYKVEGYLPALVLSILTLIITLSIATMAFNFYSRFECKPFQLLKNSLLMVLAHPIRGISLGILTWLPVALFFWLPGVFLQFVMVWLFLYFSTIAFISVWLMNKPFAALVEQANSEQCNKEETNMT